MHYTTFVGAVLAAGLPVATFAHAFGDAAGGDAAMAHEAMLQRRGFVTSLTTPWSKSARKQKGNPATAPRPDITGSSLGRDALARLTQPKKKGSRFSFFKKGSLKSQGPADALSSHGSLGGASSTKAKSRFGSLFKNRKAAQKLQSEASLKHEASLKPQGSLLPHDSLHHQESLLPHDSLNRQESLQSHHLLAPHGSLRSQDSFQSQGSMKPEGNRFLPYEKVLEEKAKLEHKQSSSGQDGSNQRFPSIDHSMSGSFGHGSSQSELHSQFSGFGTGYGGGPTDVKPFPALHGGQHGGSSSVQQPGSSSQKYDPFADDGAQHAAVPS